jgi:hypothetical protein
MKLIHSSKLNQLAQLFTVSPPCAAPASIAYICFKGFHAPALNTLFLPYFKIKFTINQGNLLSITTTIAITTKPAAALQSKHASQAHSLPQRGGTKETKDMH